MSGDLIDVLMEGLLRVRTAYAPEDIRIALSPADYKALEGWLDENEVTIAGFPVAEDRDVQASRFIIENDKGLRVSIPIRKKPSDFTAPR